MEYYEKMSTKELDDMIASLLYSRDNSDLLDQLTSIVEKRVKSNQ